MAKVYLPRFAIYTLSFTLNFLVLGIYPFSVAAVDSPPKNDKPEAAENISETIESRILLEIDRVRTNPQDYANWLESQKQYYDGVWLKLPGEAPVRTNKGLKALEEAISFLREQQPISPLKPSDLAAKDASNKLKDFATTNNIQHISYGRVTPEGIVMSWVVDELFPDRRRRNNLLDPDFKNTGVSCQNDPRYRKVCAISYSDSTTETVATQPETKTETETETVATQPQTPTPKPDIETPPQPETETKTEATQPETNTENSQTASQTLPKPPEVPPAPPVAEAGETGRRGDGETERMVDGEVEEVEAGEAGEVAEVRRQNVEEAEEVEEVEIDKIEAEIEEKQEAFEAESLPESVAINSNNSRLLENVERGALEEGDRVIPEDGSFYDSFPLEGKSGESFTISLESDEFDPFVALIDAKGNIVEQNDDINEENSNSRIRVTIPEDGVYNVIVNAYDEGGSGQYVLTVTR